MNNKNLIEATLKVLGRFNYTDSIKETEGTEIAGEYWMAVLEILREKKIAIERSYGDLYVRNRRNISSMVALCKDELARIDKEDSKNELEEKVKRLTVENLEYQNNEAKYQKDIRVYKTISIILGISTSILGLLAFFKN